MSCWGAAEPLVDLARLAGDAGFLPTLACAGAFAHHPGEHPVHSLPLWQLAATGVIAVAVVVGIGADAVDWRRATRSDERATRRGRSGAPALDPAGRRRVAVRGHLAVVRRQRGARRPAG